MKIIDNTRNRENFTHLPEGSIFRFNGNYYLKTRAMFLYFEIENFLDDMGRINYMKDLEDELYLIRAINLSNGECCEFSDETEVELLKTELHIV